MPFKSEKQRRYLWAKHPEIAEKWAQGEHHTKGKSHQMPKKRTRKRKGGSWEDGLRQSLK